MRHSTTFVAIIADTMSVVIGFSFPEEAILVSDSRISFVRKEQLVSAKDDMRKVFVLTPQLAIGFVSGNVDITNKLIRAIQKYIHDKATNTITYQLLQKLPKVATHEYRKLTAGMKEPPVMEFMYAGIIGDRGIQIPERVVIDIMTKGGDGAVPEPIGKAFMTMKDGLMSIDPPTPIIMTHKLPSNDISSMNIWSLDTIGSGASILDELKEEYSGLMTAEPGPQTGFRANLIRMHCDEFIKKTGIPTVGGAVQVIRISANGAQGVKSNFKRIFNDSSTQDISSMDFDGEKWTWEDAEQGTSGTIRSYLPPED